MVAVGSILMRSVDNFRIFIMAMNPLINGDPDEKLYPDHSVVQENNCHADSLKISGTTADPMGPLPTIPTGMNGEYVNRMARYIRKASQQD